MCEEDHGHDSDVHHKATWHADHGKNLMKAMLVNTEAQLDRAGVLVGLKEKTMMTLKEVRPTVVRGLALKA